MMSQNETLIECIKYDSDECSNFVYKIPIKSDKTLNLDQYDSLSTTLAYLDKSFFNSIWKSTVDNCYKEKTKYVNTPLNDCSGGFSIIIINTGSVERSAVKVF
ncbi:unnamed protein product [Brachionus calyciflorus]|uniref:Uncharacterized protein n=1 Tax=Brachionus calyciflorus TaxID=104777 RepID=A0A814R911_9BILA|nr:unnamed protein product [Brachionus calyciflorus]